MSCNPQVASSKSSWMFAVGGYVLVSLIVFSRIATSSVPISHPARYVFKGRPTAASKITTDKAMIARPALDLSILVMFVNMTCFPFTVYGELKKGESG